MTNAHGSKWIRPEKRLAIYLRDSLQCVYCLAALGDDVDVTLTLDHVKPRDKGGSNDARNLVTSCLSCNSARGSRTLTEFFAFPRITLTVGDPWVRVRNGDVYQNGNGTWSYNDD